MMVGAEGFEPPTLWSQTRCATRLRYAPTTSSLSHQAALRASERAEEAMRRRAKDSMEQTVENPGEQEDR
jgi:hypothetical protein